MANQPNSLWGELPKPFQGKTPKAILQEQASLLGEFTENLLTVEVKTSVSAQSFTHGFSIVAKALQNYHYDLLAATHGIALYPVALSSHDDKSTVDCISQEEFEEHLREILSADKTRAIISSLLSQIGE